MDNHYFESLYPEKVWLRAINELTGFIKEGTSAQLLSIPGVGRSTVLGLLSHNQKIQSLHFGPIQNIHFVLINFQEVKQKSNQEVFKFIFLSICESLRSGTIKRLPAGRQEYQKVNGLFRQALKLNDDLVLFQALKDAIEYLSFERKLKIVFLFDKFEEYAPSVTSEFFTNLRTLRSRFKYQFSVVFSINRPLEDLVDPLTLLDFYEYISGHYVYLDLFDELATEFRIKYIEKITKKKLTTILHKNIIEVTGGVGRIIKLSVESVLSSKEVSEKDLLGFLFSQKSIQAVLSDICRSLLPVEQNCLINNQFQEKDAVNYLEKIGIIKNKKIQIPLFAEHIKTHQLDVEKNVNKIIYSEDKKIISIGEKIISDQLTSSEFKLLFYLVKAPERIINRDEIIEVVWSDMKSTAGITDQAVDQLIFRLRRKIEEDPNNPIHLQTVKGRGFRFVP